MGEQGSGFAFLAPEWAASAGSTNDVLKERLASASPPPSGAVFAARRQTRGRGRMGNAWQGAESGDLLFSFVWKSGMPLAAAGTLSLACGLAVRDFLGGIGLKAACKWPNDVFVGDAKICGILLEGGRSAGADDVDCAPDALAVVAGIGVNLRHQPGRDEALGRETASVERCLGRVLAPEEALSALLPCLERRITAWQGGGFAAIRGDMEAALWGRGRAVRVRTRGAVAGAGVVAGAVSGAVSAAVSGVIAGLGENGDLLVRAEGGEILAVGSVAALEEIF